MVSVKEFGRMVDVATFERQQVVIVEPTVCMVQVQISQCYVL